MAQQVSQRQALRGIAMVIVVDGLAGLHQRRQLLAERGALRRAGAVVQPELRASRAQVRDHRHHRRDADAAGQQQVAPGAGLQREVVARRRDPDQVTRAQRSMQRL